MPGDRIFLKAHTDMLIEVDGTAVQARWSDYGTWQSLVIEKAASRRLFDTTEDGASALGALCSIASGSLGAFVMALILVSKCLPMQRKSCGTLGQPDCSYKVHPMEEEEEE